MRWSGRLAVGIAALIPAACSKAPAAPAPLPPMVEVISTRKPSDARVIATGQLGFEREMTLSFRVAGVLTGLSVTSGDEVTKGQRIATIDPTGLAAAEDSAAEAVAQARRALVRDELLFQKNFVSQQRIEDSRSAVRRAEAEWKIRAFDGRWTHLSAPESGVILERIGQAGEVVQPGQAVIRMADRSSPLLLKAPIPAGQVGALRPGQSARIIVSGAGQRQFAGRVRRIGAQSDARTSAVDVEIEVLDPRDLRSGEIARAEIDLPTATSIHLALPAEALLEASGTSATVLIVDDRSIVRRRAVRFEGFSGDDALVSGLSADAKVVASGGGQVSDGDRVRVISGRPAS